MRRNSSDPVLSRLKKPPIPPKPKLSAHSAHHKNNLNVNQRKSPDPPKINGDSLITPKASLSGQSLNTLSVDDNVIANIPKKPSNPVEINCELSNNLNGKKVSEDNNIISKTTFRTDKIQSSSDKHTISENIKIQQSLIRADLENALSAPAAQAKDTTENLKFKNCNISKCDSENTGNSDEDSNFTQFNIGDGLKSLIGIASVGSITEQNVSTSPKLSSKIFSPKDVKNPYSKSLAKKHKSTGGIKQRKSRESGFEYENADIDPTLKIKNKPLSTCRDYTLDGQMILASGDFDSDAYSYAASDIKPRPKSDFDIHSITKVGYEDMQAENIYEEPDARLVQDLREKRYSDRELPKLPGVVDEIYDDPDYLDPTIIDDNAIYNDPCTLHDTPTINEDDETYNDPSMLPSLPPRIHNNDSIPNDLDSSATADFDKMDYPPKVPPHKGHKIIDTHSDSDSSDPYESPYEEEVMPPPVPLHRSAQKSGENSDSDPYDSPDEWVDPTLEHAKSYPHKPPQPFSNLSIQNQPPVPAHKKSWSRDLVTNDALESSSGDDLDSTYIDSSIFANEPPGHVSPGTRFSRMGSIYEPSQYIPRKHLPSILIEEEESAEYVSPDDFHHTENPVTSDDDEMYSDEPLYQVYTDIVNKDNYIQNKKSDDSILHEKESDNLGISEYINSESHSRRLWSELPAVRKSGTLSILSSKELKHQEAMFEVISSEASYLKSLDILVSHFMMSKAFIPNPHLPSENPDEKQVLDRHQYHFLFSGIAAVKSVSERFLKDLRSRQKESIIIHSISDILLDYAKNHFNCYIKYCSNQVFQDRTHQSLKQHNPAFLEALTELEASPACQGLRLHSFLTLPMQRITRMPLLVDKICSMCEDEDEFNSTDRALKVLNSVVHSCNEGARKMERTEEMYFIQKTLQFKSKPIPLVSASRWLVKKGHVAFQEGEKMKKYYLLQFFKGRSPYYLFLFTDLLLIAKMKGIDNFKVFDHCQRSLTKVEILPNIPVPESAKVGSMLPNSLRYAFTLIFLENIEKMTKAYHCFLETETDTTRWLEALNPSMRPTIEGEAIYEEWDCPQVQIVHPYQAQQSDEISLNEGDIISVLRKLPDGWAEGVRLRDDEKGWFPINHTEEIDSKHMRAKNLMQRYRLINASQNIISQLGMI